MLDFEDYIEEISPGNFSLDLTNRNDLYDLVSLIEFLLLYPNVSNLILENCDISDKKIQPLINYNKTLENITCLNLSTNLELGKTGFKTLIQIFPNLKQLNISYTLIRGQDFFEVFFKSHSILQELTHLFTDGNELFSQDLIDLSRYKNFVKLKYLSLKNNDIDDFKIPDICVVLNHFPVLTSIDIEDNRISIQGAQILKDAKIFSSLTEINFGRNSLTFDGLALLIPQLNLPYITSLDLKDNHLRSEGANLIAECNFKSLQNLDISINAITTEGASMISKAPWYPKLLILNLRSNSLTDDVIIELFPKNNNFSLERLNLADNYITDQGIQWLLERYPPNLSNINLSSNEFGKIGVKCLGVISQNNVLKVLDISNNHIDAPCFNSDNCQETFMILTKVEELSLKSNFLGFDTIIYLLDYISNTNHKLKILNLKNTLQIHNIFSEERIVGENSTKFINLNKEARHYKTYHPDTINSIVKKASSMDIEIIIDNVYQPFFDLLRYVYTKTRENKTIEITKLYTCLEKICKFQYSETVIDYLKKLIEHKEISINIFDNIPENIKDRLPTYVFEESNLIGEDS